MLEFFKNYEKLISGLAAIVGVVGLFVAAYQIRATSKQVEGSTIYQIQKDGRELLNSLHSEPSVFDYIFLFKGSANYDPMVVAKAERKIVEITQYFSSVVNQRQEGVISNKYWKTFEKEICGFYKLEPVARFWKERGQKGSYGQGFKDQISKCMS